MSRRITGRQIFSRLNKIINICYIIINGIPTGLSKWLLIKCRYRSGLIVIGLRYLIVKKLANKCGENVSIHDSVILRNTEKISLGKNISIHPFCYIDAQGNIEIGDNVSIAHGVSIISFEHDYHNNDLPIKYAKCISKKIVIEDNVWIGAGVRILGGVKIGNGSVIGANSVVTKNIPENCVAAGIPAKKIGNRIE